MVDPSPPRTSAPPPRDAEARAPWWSSSRLLVALVLGASFVGGSLAAGAAAVKVFRIRHADKTIVVTGSVKRRITSDRIVWRATLVGRAPELAVAYRSVAAGVPKALDLLKEKGVDPKSITTSAVRIRELHPRDKDGNVLEETVVAYSVEQDVSVESQDVERITEVSREATKLLEQGIQIQSDAPKYLYTKLGDLKVQLLAEAAKDARQRADQIAQNTGAHVTQLASARMGVMQVNAANESTVAADGMNDTTSVEKDVLAIVTATFAVD